MDDSNDQTANNRRRGSSGDGMSLATFTSVAALSTRVAVLDRDVDGVKDDLRVQNQDRAGLHAKIDHLTMRQDKTEVRLDSLHGILKWILGVVSLTFVSVIAGCIMFVVTHGKP
jgi:hypothetical protein